MTSSRRRILLFINEPALGEAVATALTPLGHHVLRPRVFAEARRVLDLGVDALITEVRLGPYNGLHLAIRGRFRDPGLPALIIGDGDPVLEAEALHAGALFLTQPVSSLTIVEAVTKLLQERSGRRSVRRRVAPIDASADGVGVRVLEVSYEGALIELPAGATPLPRAFTLRLFDDRLALAAEWVWTAESATGPTMYGLRFTLTAPRVAVAWRQIVDAAVAPVAPTA